MGERYADADEPRRDHVGRHIEHATSFRVVELFDIDEQEREALLRRQVGEKARGECVAVIAEQLGETRIVDFGLCRRIGTVAELG